MHVCTAQAAHCRLAPAATRGAGAAATTAAVAVLSLKLTRHIPCDVVGAIPASKEAASALQVARVACSPAQLHAVVFVTQAKPWEAADGSRVLQGVVGEVHGLRGSCSLWAQQVRLWLLQGVLLVPDEQVLVGLPSRMHRLVMHAPLAAAACRCCCCWVVQAGCVHLVLQLSQRLCVLGGYSWRGFVLQDSRAQAARQHAISQGM